MSLSDELKKRSVELMKDPRVTRLLQNEQFVRAMVALVQVPGKVNSFTSDQAERVARALHMPTPEDYQQLVRRVDRLESEVEDLMRRVGHGR
jgi:cell division FtsZ-interacting protein ZapD